MQAIGLAHWPQAAGLLNRDYSPENIKAVVETLNASQIQSIYLAAVGDVAVGDGSKVATAILETSQTLSAARSTILASGITMKEFVDFETKSSSELQDQYPSQRFIAIKNSLRALPTSVLYMKMSTEKTIPNPPQPAPPPKRPDFGVALPPDVTSSPQHQQLTSFIHNRRWQDAAALLNSYRREHILALLPDLASQQSESIYLGAIARNGVGEGADVAKTIIGASPDLQAARAEVTSAGITMKEYVDFRVNPPMVGELFFGRKRTIQQVIENLSAKSLSHLQFATDQTVYMFRSGRTGTIAEERDRRVAEFRPKGAVAGLAEAGTRAITGDEDRAEHVGAFTENLTDAGLAAAPVVGAGVAKARGIGGGAPAGSPVDRNTPTLVGGPGGTRLPAKAAPTPAATPKPTQASVSPAPVTRAPEPVRAAATGSRSTSRIGPMTSGGGLQTVTASSSQRERPPPPPLGLPAEMTFSRIAGETKTGTSPTVANGKSTGTPASALNGASLMADLMYREMFRGRAVYTPTKPGYMAVGGQEVSAADLRLGGKPVAVQGPIVTGGRVVPATNASVPPDARSVVGVIAAEVGDVYLVVSVPVSPAYAPGAGPATPTHAPGTSQAPAALPGAATPAPVRDPTPQQQVEAPGVSKEAVRLAAKVKIKIGDVVEEFIFPPELEAEFRRIGIDIFKYAITIKATKTIVEKGGLHKAYDWHGEWEEFFHRVPDKLSVSEATAQRDKAFKLATQLLQQAGITRATAHPATMVPDYAKNVGSTGEKIVERRAILQISGAKLTSAKSIGYDGYVGAKEVIRVVVEEDGTVTVETGIAGGNWLSIKGVSRADPTLVAQNVENALERAAEGLKLNRENGFERTGPKTAIRTKYDSAPDKITILIDLEEAPQDDAQIDALKAAAAEAKAKSPHAQGLPPTKIVISVKGKPLR